MICSVITSTVFFCSPVYAYDPQFSYKQTEHYQSGSLYVTSSATQFYPVTYDSEAPSQWFGAAVSEIFITVRLYNSSTLDCYVNTADIQLTFGNSAIVPYVCGIDNYGLDLFLSMESSSNLLRITPSNDYSLWTGLVIPPQSSLYLAASVFVQCQDTTVRPDQVQLTGVQTVTSGVSTGTYTYSGDPTPYDLSGIVSDLNAIDLSTSSALAELQAIKNALVYNGTISSPGFNPTQAMVRTINTGVTYYYEGYSIYTGQSHIDVDTVEVADADSVYHTYTRKIPITVSIQQENYMGYAVANTGGADKNALLFSDLLPASQYISYEIGESTSDVFQNPRIIYTGGNYVSLIFDYKLGKSANGGFEGLVPNGLCNSTFVIYAYVRGNNSLELNQNFTSPSQSYYLTDMKLDSDVRITVGEIRDNLNQGSQPVQDNSTAVNNDADQVAVQMQNVHQQEMQYFQDNQDAIAATGLNNFQFNQNHISAFTMITTQFTELWNALGDYTLVFIFTLLLSLATYIIRHEPTTKVKQYRSSVAAERAERISYYGKKNAEARARSSGDQGAEFWDAVRRINS